MIFFCVLISCGNHHENHLLENYVELFSNPKLNKQIQVEYRMFFCFGKFNFPKERSAPIVFCGSSSLFAGNLAFSGKGKWWNLRGAWMSRWKLGSKVRISGYNPTISHVQAGYNTFQSLLPTSWDVQEHPPELLCSHPFLILTDNN